jgi:hypothetical protein
MTKTLLTLCGVFAAITVLNGVTTQPAHAGEGYMTPDEWTEVYERLKDAEQGAGTSEPPAAPVEAPVAPAPAQRSDSPGVAAPISGGSAAAPVAVPAAVQLPNTGARSPGVVLPLAAMALAFAGAMLIGTGRGVRSAKIDA